MNSTTPDSIRRLKSVRKITALTAYDYGMAQMVAAAGVDVILVGDSLGMVIYGQPNTHSVTLEDTIRHTQAVMRGVERVIRNENRGESAHGGSLKDDDLMNGGESGKESQKENRGGYRRESQAPLVVADMPIGTCDFEEVALSNVEVIKDQTGVQAVKIEGRPDVCRAVVEAGMAVMGHTGLKPQQAETMGVKGRSDDQAQAVLEEALALEAAGCFSVVLECVPADLARRITERLTIPTIGIGAGVHCNGQILVTHDLLGLFDDFSPKFLRRYADLKSASLEAMAHFKADVQAGRFPSKEESY